VTVILGPILGFRGLEDGEWRTCALAVTEGNVTPPELTWFVVNKGRPDEVESASQQTHLRSFKGFEVWRFDWSGKQSDGDQTVVYTLGFPSAPNTSSQSVEDPTPRSSTRSASDDKQSRNDCYPG
jgi:hypothetical protein